MKKSIGTVYKRTAMMTQLRELKYRQSKLTDTEDSVENFLVDTVTTLGGKTRKLGDKTWPDRLVMLPTGIIFFVELKRPSGGAYEPGQRELMESLNAINVNAYRACTKCQVRDILEGEITGAHIVEYLVKKHGRT